MLWMCFSFCIFFAHVAFMTVCLQNIKGYHHTYTRTACRLSHPCVITLVHIMLHFKHVYAVFHVLVASQILDSSSS